MQQFGVGGIQVEAVDEAAGFGFVEFGGGFGEIAAGTEAFEERGAEALEIGGWGGVRS